ncbi:MAG: heavy metal-binding domain-containing protein [Phycisphaeraceae bacterium]|nr:heavy metal-binding domain-containing protein [Phycisphaeraceae bacterium]
MNSDSIGMLFQLVFTVGVGGALLAIGLLAGRWAERRHLASLAQREEELRAMLLTDVRGFPVAAHPGQSVDPSGHARLVTGEAVISSDYFKTFVSALRKIVGGEMKNYQGLLDRARREATVRMLSEARAAGFDSVCNVRYAGYDITSGISGGKKPVVSVAVQAIGTAYRRRGA